MNKYLTNQSTRFTSYHVSTPPKTLKQVQGDELQSECNKLNHPQPVIASVSEAIQRKETPIQTKKAFTLAEIMIVLMVIGILTAILLPSARNAMPNEDILKFKKAHNALHTTIRELVNSDKYYLDGDFSKKPDGSTPDCCYHAHAFADVLNAQVISCDSGIYSYGTCYNTKESIDSFKTEKGEDFLEKFMLNVTVSTSCNNQIKLQDGSLLLYSPPAQGDSCVDENGFEAIYGEAMFVSSVDLDLNDDGVTNAKDATLYSRICAGLEDGECMDATSYLIRKDGKIISSAKVDEWLAESIQEKE